MNRFYKTVFLGAFLSFIGCFNAYSEETPCDHEFVNDTLAATCTDFGCVIGKCTKCGVSDTLAKLQPTGHDFKQQVLSEPSCLEGGVTLNVCKVCGFENKVTTAALGHDYERTEHKSATCTKTGLDTYVCTRCEDSYKDTLAPKGHDYVVEVVEPTLKDSGYTKHTCSRCDDSYIDNIVPKLDIKDYYALKISEVMPCNIATIINKDDYNFVGYIEVQNPATHTINLENCILTHYKKKSNGQYEVKWVWKINSALKVSPASYTLIWMDGTDKAGHAPYKLDPDGGYLTLVSEGIKIDSLAYDEADAHVAYGRYGDNAGMMEPTPGEENTEVYTSRCRKPTFSVSPGILSAKTTLELTSKTAGADIYYTLNGTAPSASNGIKYTSPIPVEKNMNIRAIACKKGLLPSKITTGSYIFKDEAHSKCHGFTVPIVSITIDSLYYNDKTYGMFVVGSNGIHGEKNCQSEKANYNRDWKRPLNFEYFVDGKQVLSQEVEAAIEGGCSRNEKVKSISLKTSKKSGNSKYDYKFFASKPSVSHQTLHLRNGGTAYSCIPFRDGLMQTFAHGMNIDYQAYQPVAYYFNGKYIGLMGLHERTNADYVKANYGYEDDEIDLITISDQLGIRASKGSLDSYDEMADFLNDNDPNSDGYYEGACKRMDMDEYIDYQIFQQFIVNTDWPGNNTKIWRAKDNGVFRWIVFDTDFGFGLCGYNWLNSSGKNMISWCQGKGSTSWANQSPWMVEIFKPLSQNKTFKKKFTTRYLINLADRFSEENINHVFDSIIGLVSDEFCAAGGNDSQLDAMREFALNRPNNIYKHLNSYVEGDSVVDFNFHGNVEGAVFALNGEKVSSYSGKYIAGYDFELKAYAPVGYKFEGWTISDSSSLKSLNASGAQNAFMPGKMSGVVKKSVDIYALFTKCEEAVPTVVINEICASSDSKSGNADDYHSYPDWIELYNYGEKDIDLSGFILSNNKYNLASELPLNSNMIIKAGGFKVLWAKGDNTLGAKYLNFKIDNDKASTICLSYLNPQDHVDCVKYATHLTNYSYGRKTDNGDSWVVFTECPDEDKFSATPGKANGSVCELVYTNDELALVGESAVRVYPNPVSDVLNIVSDKPVDGVTVYSMSGSAVLRESGAVNAVNVQHLPLGVYMVEVVASGNIYRIKLIKH
ncbi:MAG: CotH kinase family protein [Paludibacteraceae bacterium]|nr:CotH kinase family protein [Paludibacteraceae bacterium]